MSAEPKHRYTLQEYFALERASGIRYEYLDGEIYAMTGASLKHNQITANVSRHFGNQLEDRPCNVLTSDMRVKVPAANSYHYPDVVVVCTEPELEMVDGLETLTNPTLIVEVLSPTTGSYDKGEKFEHYRSVKSLKEYLLIAQDKPHVVQCIQQSETTWTLIEIQTSDTMLTLSSINCRLTVSEIYRRVKFDSGDQIHG